ncbi:malate synthase A [Luteimonas sp. MC1572]|uniref:malate synthase A n=1 Tax=Luteimonas sp. MC1572 TaxID=2799325 RepID=UPI0018F0FF26|nr:malate synthase A [Luteimonas sp. MC1572]MBJ6982091.1 malate synthase A [Luteimonas sp. MC1572]QQO03385.1 malate synthase A [Luteimonas sp. MC1572]
MSAVLHPVVPAPAVVSASVAPAPDVLGGDALAFLADLHHRFESERLGRLAARRERQAGFDDGALPDFRADTRAIRAGDWRVVPLPPVLQDRRVEITGPVDAKMVINALNSGASCYMADFEDSTSPTWDNLVAGQRALRAAVAGDLEFTSDAGKAYRLKPEAERAVLMVRPRGWHLDEKHVAVDGARISASLFDAGLFCFHNAAALAAADRGPYLYLPKLESMEEARLWDDVLAHVEDVLGLAPGQVKVTVLIETLPAVFEMDEILHALRGRIAGLNCGRWDYIFSYIKTFRRHRDRVLPERGQVTMAAPFLKAYSELLIRTCHRRGAHAMGGMAAQVPVAGDPVANEAAMERVRADKLREASAGHDGTWVAHPALVPIARGIFDAAMPGANQHHVLRGDAGADRDALLAAPTGTITRKGFEGNVEVCVRYLAAWLDGNGCVPIHWLMEDAATAEIARAQLWQWLHHGDGGDVHGVRPLLHLHDGDAIDFALLECALLNLPSRLAAEPMPGAGRVHEAIALLEELTRADELAAFLTLPAYERLS